MSWTLEMYVLAHPAREYLGALQGFGKGIETDVAILLAQLRDDRLPTYLHARDSPPRQCGKTTAYDFLDSMCSAWLIDIGYFHAQMEKSSITMRSIYDFNNPFTAPNASEIDELADKSQSLEQRISSLNESYETLKKREVELTEWRWVLREAGGFFDRARGQTEEIRQSLDDDDDAPLLRDVEQNGGDTGAERSFTVMNIGFVAGVIPRERMGAFERILWRTLRGNLYMNQSEIPEPIINPENNEETSKNVFIIFAHGKEIIAKIRKISESLGADLYSVDENSELRRDQIREVNTRLSDLASVLKNTKSTLDAELTAISRNLAAWMVVIKKEKATYETLNRFSYDHQRKTLIAEAWAPTNSLGLIKSTLSDVNERAGLSVPTIVNQIKTTKTPPTYFKSNRFTNGFQTIIDAYGTIKYREVNPALPAIVTFPFMFAVMFGDAGHGVILLLSACAMIYFEKKLERSKLDELFSMMFYGRYIIFMMGLYSIYTGLLYCDAFSLALPWFKSMWVWDNDGKGPTASRVEGYTYPFGLDYRWHDTENDLLFSNSYKMKLSILLGWTHMTFSLMWSLVNFRYFKNKIDIWGNFVPGMIFFQSIFGYLAFTIVYKWSIDWAVRGENPPSLLNMLIYMFLRPGYLEDGVKPLFPGQAKIQVVLLLLALGCVPVLLFLKPFWLRYEHNRARALGYRGIGENSRVSALDGDDDDDSRPLNGGRESFGDDDDGIAMITQDIGHGEESEEFEFSEVMIHQVIHTIGKYIHVVFRANIADWTRILSQLCVPHGLLPPSLGALPRPSTSVHCPLGNDHEERICYRGVEQRHRWRPHPRLRLRLLVRTYRGRVVCHGGHIGYVAFAASALGRGNE